MTTVGEKIPNDRMSVSQIPLNIMIMMVLWFLTLGQRNNIKQNEEIYHNFCNNKYLLFVVFYVVICFNNIKNFVHKNQLNYLRDVIPDSYHFDINSN